MGHSPSRVPDSLGVEDLACSGERVGGGGNGSASGEVKEGALYLRKIPASLMLQISNFHSNKI